MREAEKEGKYGDLVRNMGCTFTPFVAETTGGLGGPRPRRRCDSSLTPLYRGASRVRLSWCVHEECSYARHAQIEMSFTLLVNEKQNETERGNPRAGGR